MNTMQLIDRLARHAADRPNTLAYIDPALNQQMTWTDLRIRVDELSQQLRSKCEAGSVILIQMANNCDFVAAFLATLSAGMTAFPISMETPAIELNAVTEQTGASLLLKSISLLRELSTNRKNVSPGLLLHSSGSTGKPKIVCRSRESLDAVCDQMCRSIGIGADDRVLASVPLCHSYGLEHGLLAPIWAGATVHLVRGLDLPLIQRELLTSRITLLPAVPSVYEMLANLSIYCERFPELRAAYSAGAALPASVANRFVDRCGIRVGQLFGASEIGSVTYSDPRNPHFNSASVGQPMPGVNIRITNGLLAVKANSMFTGYLNDTTPIDADGFYLTGDLAQLDDHGNLIITGRVKLLIDVGGLKVNPIEVENVLIQHPTVGDCVVIPVQQSETVVRLKAIITPASLEIPVSIEDLRTFAREKLAGYKVPRLFEVRQSLPRTDTGKILRHMVQA